MAIDRFYLFGFQLNEFYLMEICIHAYIIKFAWLIALIEKFACGVFTV